MHLRTRADCFDFIYMSMTGCSEREREREREREGERERERESIMFALVLKLMKPSILATCKQKANYEQCVNVSSS